MSFPAYRDSPEVYGRINMRHWNNFHSESVINVLRIYVFKFVMFIEIYSILQNHLPEPVPTQFFRRYELLSFESFELRFGLVAVCVTL